MALALNEIQSLTTDFWYPRAYDNYFKSNVLIYRLLKNGKKVSGGEKIRVPIWYGDPKGGAFGYNTTFNTSHYEAHTAARFDWALYYEPCTYGIKDKIENAGPQAEVDLINSKLDMMQKAIRDSMADGIYSDGTGGGDTKPLTGLLAMINSTSSTSYGTIAEDDLAEWAPGAVTTTSESLTLTVMRALKRACKVGDAPEDRPTIYITTDALRDAYEGLLQPQQRFNDSKLAAAGFENLTFDGGRPVVGDTKCPSGYMFALNENYLDMQSHQDFFFKHTEWMRPTDEWKYTMQVVWTGNLVCKRRSAHGYHSNLS